MGATSDKLIPNLEANFLAPGVEGIVSSSIIYSSGSNKFGDTLDDLHRFTGSLETTSSTLTIDSVGGVSGSITSTGSFGRVETAGNINTVGRIYESGTSVIDHATAMAIVFGG